MKWQEVRDMGLGLFKKRSRSRTLWVSGSVGFLGLLTMLLLLTGTSETHTGDITCGTECISYINFTTTYWRICFEKDFELIQTNPKVPVDVYVPTRGKGNWRLWNPTEDCLERTTNYRPYPNRFKIVGHKKVGETVKWWSDALNVPDPVWSSPNLTVSVYSGLNNTINQNFAPNWRLAVYNGNMTTGNFTMNMTEYNITYFTNASYLFNITNNNSPEVTVYMNINDSKSWYVLKCSSDENTTISDCYQESFNISDQKGTDGNCGLNYSGIATVIGVPDYAPIGYEKYWRDGRWNSWSTLNSSNSSINITYVKPSGAISADWKVKYWDITERNYTDDVVSTCWNYNSTHLFFRITRDAYPGARKYFSCYNGSWVTLRTSGTTNNDYRQNHAIYEEAVLWDFPISYNSSNPQYTTITTSKTRITNLSTNESYYMNCTLDLINCYQKYINWSTNVTGGVNNCSWNFDYNFSI